MSSQNPCRICSSAATRLPTRTPTHTKSCLHLCSSTTAPHDTLIFRKTSSSQQQSFGTSSGHSADLHTSASARICVNRVNSVSAPAFLCFDSAVRRATSSSLGTSPASWTRSYISFMSPNPDRRPRMNIHNWWQASTCLLTLSSCLASFMSLSACRSNRV